MPLSVRPRGNVVLDAAVLLVISGTSTPRAVFWCRIVQLQGLHSGFPHRLLIRRFESGMHPVLSWTSHLYATNYSHMSNNKAKYPGIMSILTLPTHYHQFSQNKKLLNTIYITLPPPYFQNNW